jgi:hypothetical protein
MVLDQQAVETAKLSLLLKVLEKFLFTQTQIRNIVNYHYHVFPKVTVDTNELYQSR